MAQTGTIGKPIQMNKPTPWIGTVISIIGLIGTLIAFWMNLSAEIATIKANRENDRVKYDERYIEQRDANREIKSLLQDLKQEQYNQRVLIEQKQNRR